MTSPRTTQDDFAAVERRPIRASVLKEAIRSVRQNKADFWHYVRLYERETNPHSKHWYMENLLSHNRRMKAALEHAREMRK